MKTHFWLSMDTVDYGTQNLLPVSAALGCLSQNKGR